VLGDLKRRVEAVSHASRVRADELDELIQTVAGAVREIAGAAVAEGAKGAEDGR
jgi:hypothetical protein